MKSLFYNINGIEQRNKDIIKEKIAINKGFNYLVIWDNENINYSIDKFINIIKKLTC
ncbi:MAG: hypothetical protein RSE41_04060 [Clostridia bacterium]